MTHGKSRVKAVLDYKKPEGKQSNITDVPVETDIPAMKNTTAKPAEAEKNLEAKDNITLFQAVLLGEKDFCIAAGDDCLLSTNIADIGLLFQSADPYLEIFSFERQSGMSSRKKTLRPCQMTFSTGYL